MHTCTLFVYAEYMWEYKELVYIEVNLTDDKTKHMIGLDFNGSEVRFSLSKRAFMLSDYWSDVTFKYIKLSITFLNVGNHNVLANYSNLSHFHTN